MKPGLWANIHKRRKSGKRMRKPGEKGAPSPEALAKARASSEGKEKFEPHMMYDPKTGKGYKANKPEDHERMTKMGYKHEPKEEMTTTASIPNPADTAMGPRFTTHNVMDRRKKKKPALLKRFKTHMENNA